MSSKESELVAEIKFIETELLLLEDEKEHKEIKIRAWNKHLKHVFLINQAI